MIWQFLLCIVIISSTDAEGFDIQNIWRHFKKAKFKCCSWLTRWSKLGFNIMTVPNYRLVVWRLLLNVTLACMQVWGNSHAFLTMFGLMQLLTGDCCIWPLYGAARRWEPRLDTALVIFYLNPLKKTIHGFYFQVISSLNLHNCSSQKKNSNTLCIA